MTKKKSATATMPPKKKEHTEEKTALHTRNRHRGRYDFKLLMQSTPALQPFVKLNDYGDESIDFFNPDAVKMLNKALLKQYYSIEHWDIPKDYLCPPIPGRADYIHHIADVLGSSNKGIIPTGRKITCLDIGVGANCVYPIIGHHEYGWSFMGSDIDPVALESARKIIEANSILHGAVELRMQPQPKDIFKGIIQKDERIDLTICNPPFHASAAEAESGTLRKLSHLKSKRITQTTLNFGGQNNELWCTGGEERFIKDMIHQSSLFAGSVMWFSTLVSKASTLKGIYEALKKVKAVDVKTVPMGQGNKVSRLVAWSFWSKEERRVWRER
jgi:23S rRNA (adenine1618-N6)-methyltransferase